MKTSIGNLKKNYDYNANLKRSQLDLRDRINIDDGLIGRMQY